MRTLGINAAFHDSAACLVVDGEVIAAAEEERFSRIKHAKRPIPFSAYELPFNAIAFCLEKGGVSLSQIDHFAYSFDPSLLVPPELDAGGDFVLPFRPEDHAPLPGADSVWDPLFWCYLTHASRQLASGAPHHLKKKLGKLPPEGPAHWHFVEHHTAHAASALYAAPFEEAAVLTLDGRGERVTTSYSIGRGYEMERIGEVRMPHSLGLLYEEATTYLGFLHSSDEYKVMALAAYGTPRYLPRFQDLVELGSEGQYTIKPHDLQELFGPARERGAPIEQHHFDIAYALQRTLEDSVLELSRWLHSASRMDSLCMAGGVALNCVMNSQLRDRGPFRDIWVQPASGDAGTALGAALWIDAKVRNAKTRSWQMEHAYYGPSFSDDEIERYLRWTRTPYRRLENLPEEVAQILLQDKIIGWFQGPMEFGPRALGARSIIASPLSASMQQRLNDLKDREDFRPVAPVVLHDAAAQWFQPAQEAPFMLFVFDVREERRYEVPAICHVDSSARVQTIRREHNPRYYDTIAAFGQKTGVPVLVNTSFNSRGEPVVCSPQDAVECFWSSPLDVLVIGNCVVEK